MVDWCRCPRGDPPSIKLCLLSALFLAFSFFFQRQECRHMLLQRTPCQTRRCYCTMFHTAVASSCVCASPGSRLCLLFICKQFWPPTHRLYLQQCQSVDCNVDFPLIIGCLHLLSSTHITLLWRNDEIYPCCSRSTYTVTDFRHCCLMIY